MEQTTVKTSVGIDVCAASLDVWVHPAGVTQRFMNDTAGVAALIAWLGSWPGCVVALEATGGLECLAVRGLQGARIAVSVVNPERIWAWRKVIGQPAKNDRLDARAIAQFAACVQTRVSVPEVHPELKQLLRRREQFSRMLADEKKRVRRAGDYPAVRKSYATHIAMLTRDIAALTRALRAAIRKDTGLHTRFKLLKTVPGVGEITAMTLLIELPELGTLEPKPIVALAGLAPHVNESGTWKGKASLRGGRAQVRAKLFMAASSATRCNPVLKAYCQQLLDRHKHWKSAITATMRKLLIILNAILATNTSWKTT